MPTSSKLGKILDLSQQRVYLLENMGSNLRTKYKVHSIIKENNLILLDLNCINNLFFSEILLKNTEYLPERTINNLKVDFVNNEIKEIIEIKGLISDKEEIIFPYLNSNRVIRQLKELAKSDYNVRFVFILMNPKINTIKLDEENTEFMKQFELAVRKKINFQIFRICWKDREEHLEEVEYKLRKNIFKIKNPM